ncbi:hypothetical protein [Lonepinella sp. BR2357]|uniref:hypothetical protein n=1 Tax=Lonepinella sp. BR2357 TaxID=3434549 RepID=UPI003F6DABBD
MLNLTVSPLATVLSFTRYASTSCRWQNQRSKFYEFCACAKESRQRKAHPDLNESNQSAVIFCRTLINGLL